MGERRWLGLLTAFTLELTGNMDLPFTRAPQYSLGLLVGIAWIDLE